MKIIKTIILSVFIFAVTSIFIPNLTFAAFSTADFQGTWYGRALVSGPDSDWEYSTVTVDAQGNFSSTSYRSDGTQYTINDTLNINSAGIVTAVNHPAIHGVVSSDKNIMVFTNTWDSSAGDYGIQILVKDGGSSTSFSQSDLTGTWYLHSLSSGQYPGWENGTITIDSQGNVSFNITDSTGSQTNKTNGDIISISSSGMISASKNASLKGVMSPDKTFAVLIETDDQSQTYILDILVKGGGSFSLADLTGTWYGHSLISGSNLGAWSYSPIAIDSSGSATAYTTYYDNTTDSGTYTLSITGDGIVTAAESPSFNGIMNLGKNITVFTETDSTPAGTMYSLMVAMKVNGSPPVAGFSATPLSGKKPLQVAFTDSSTGDITGWSWDFGDGSTSTAQNPSHTYSKPGKYTVNLTVTGLLGTNVDTKTDYIDVKSPGMPWLSILLGN